MLKSEVIKSFLIKNTLPDLESLYAFNMECQVNVAPDGGERIKGEYEGRQWSGFTNSVGEVWKSFRIPYRANTEPTYTDRPMSFDLAKHVEGIGMTGWDWVNKRSRWVAFDFDAIIGHSEKHPTKLTFDELNAVKQAAMELPWTTIRRSTSGKGLHIYVFLDVDIEIVNHTEHAALARSILNYMSVQTGFPFASHVDICGGNMWVWHRKMIGTDGLTCIKKGCSLNSVPPNWRDHLQVVSGKRRRILPDFASDKFEEVSGQKQHVLLDASHKTVIKYLDASGASFWWDEDHHMLVCHTFDLKKAHETLGLRGIFDTVSTGAEQGVDHNCFMYPLRDGAWVVRRYTTGVNEAPTWEHDNKGWTRCFLNKVPDLKTVCRGLGAVEHPSGGFVFPDGVTAGKATQALNIDLGLPEKFQARETKLKQHKDGRLIAEVKRDTSDDTSLMGEWLCEKVGKFTRVYDGKLAVDMTVDVGNYDDVVRHVVSESGQGLGWALRSEKQWTDEPLQHVTTGLRSLGLIPAEVQTIIGNNIFKPWQLVNKPFEPEYIGDRCWNRHAAQFRFPPNLDKDTYHCPSWDMILNHIGQGLDNFIGDNKWCQENVLLTGADYLRCWIASLLQDPYAQLPYLFLWSEEQNTGKSILHEALSLLFTRGYVRADKALQTNFNGELEHAVLCVVEETDLQRNKSAYNMIKDFVTSIQISLHIKGCTPVMIPNTTHWIQCANEATACPLFKGDTRITVINVPPLTEVVGKHELLNRLSKEAPDFLASVLKLELPFSGDRLNIPVIETHDKRIIARTNDNLLGLFMDEHCYRVDGNMISIGSFYEQFMAWLDPTERYQWTKQRVSKMMPAGVIKGRCAINSNWCYGNITFDADAKPGAKYVLNHRGDTLVRSN